MNDENDGKEISDIRNIPPTIYNKNPRETVARPSVPDKIETFRNFNKYGGVVDCFSQRTNTRLVTLVLKWADNIKANIKANITHKNIDGLCKLHAVLIEFYSLYKDAIERFTTQMIEIDYGGDEKFVEIIETYMGKEQLDIDRERKKIIVSLILFIAAFSVCPTYKPQRAGSYKKKRPTKRKNRKSFKKRKSKRKTKRRR